MSGLGSDIMNVFDIVGLCRSHIKVMRQGLHSIPRHVTVWSADVGNNVGATTSTVY